MAFFQISIILFLFPFTFSNLCYNSNLNPILVNKDNKIELGPNTESCYEYQLYSNSSKIILVFPKVVSSTSEVLLFNDSSKIHNEINKANYKNYIDRFLINENPFKEIDLKYFSKSIYIVFRDNKYSNIYTNYFILYDTELPITLTEGKPLTIKYFIQNNQYKFDFLSTKNLTLVYSTKVKSKKYISITYNNQTILPKTIDNTDHLYHLRTEDNKLKKLYITVEDIEEGTEDQEFSLIVYEKNINQFYEIKENNLHTINYLNLNKDDEKQIFFFYYKIGKYINTNTINFKLDPLAKTSNYINIESGIYHSIKEIPDNEKVVYFKFGENKLPIDYDINSDEIKKIYFQDTDTTYDYRYIFFKVEISALANYYSPNKFIITVGSCLEEKDMKYHGQYYIAQTISLTTKPYIPSYVKINLDSNEKYILTSPYPDITVYTKGDLVFRDNNGDIKINKDNFMDPDEILILDGFSEITISLLLEDTTIVNFYLEKYEEKDVHIIENDRNYEPFQVRFTEEECKYGTKKYLLGIYNKNIYNNVNKTYTKYWTSEDGDFYVYYRNSIKIENNNIFPTEFKYNQRKEFTIVLNFNLDFFTFYCIQPGTLYLRSPYKVYNETTHHITQNSITNLDISNKLEIIQLSAPLKTNSQYLYFGIFSKYGKKIKISAEYPTLFDDTYIYGVNNLFLLKIDLYKYEPDQLAIKILAEESTSIEVVEVIKYNFTEYTVVRNERLKHFSNNHIIKFLDPETKNVKFNIKGLKDVTISYGIVELFTDDINYLPMAYQFKEDTIRRLFIKGNENIDIVNPFLNKEKSKKKYLAFIFSIISFEIYEYDAQIIEDDEDPIIMKSYILGIVLGVIGSIILFAIIGIIVYCWIKNKKNKKLDLDNNNNNNNKTHKFEEEEEEDDNDKRLYKSLDD